MLVRRGAARIRSPPRWRSERNPLGVRPVPASTGDQFSRLVRHDRRGIVAIVGVWITCSVAPVTPCRHVMAMVELAGADGDGPVHLVWSDGEERIDRAVTLVNG
jgi:hypothetical protein